MVTDHSSKSSSQNASVAAPAKGRSLIWIFGALLTAAVAVALLMRTLPRSKEAQQPGPRLDERANTNPAPVTAMPTGPQTNTAASTAPPLRPKSIEDLKVGAVKLEKAKGNSLVYAVGTLRNDSPHQRYGVRLELQLTGPDGAMLGLAKDYRSVLEPQQDWHFRALVLDSKAVSAKVAAIREEE
jgi:hypothetical protein